MQEEIRRIDNMRDIEKPPHDYTKPYQKEKGGQK